MVSNLLFARQLRENGKKKDEFCRPVDFRLKKTNIYNVYRFISINNIQQRTISKFILKTQQI